MTSPAQTNYFNIVPDNHINLPSSSVLSQIAFNLEGLKKSLLDYEIKPHDLKRFQRELLEIGNLLSAEKQSTEICERLIKADRIHTPMETEKGVKLKNEYELSEIIRLWSSRFAEDCKLARSAYQRINLV